MNPRTFLRGAALVLTGLTALTAGLLALAQQATTPPGPPQLPAGAHRLSGPYTHDNLSIFLIHGEDRLKLKSYLTLPEALEQKKAVIHETQAVNRLTVENLSPTEELLILSGDILKGGQQDRFAQFDLIVPPKSGKVPLTCFCIEATAPRWMRRLEGADKKFAGSPGQLSSNALIYNARGPASQHAVWLEAAKVQNKLSANLGVSVKAKESDSSLALSLQAKKVREATDRYVQKLAAIVQDKKDVIGYACVVNGKVASADIYGSSDLFRKVWPRLLQASATEALAAMEKGKKVEPVTGAAVTAFLKDAEQGKATSMDVARDIRQLTRESPRNVLFETREEKRGAMVRQNYLAK
jgi:hypothetical protein